eukprot:SAG22_NODE_3773_length_1534_cov_10.901742_1_plen_109_part_10
MGAQAAAAAAAAARQPASTSADAHGQAVAAAAVAAAAAAAALADRTASAGGEAANKLSVVFPLLPLSYSSERVPFSSPRPRFHFADPASTLLLSGPTWRRDGCSKLTN